MFYDSKIAIKTTKLSKCYRLYDKPIHRLKQALPWENRSLFREFWALRDVGLTVYRGQTLGVIGRNGSGKSTLLQLICGTITPTEGRVEVNGRIGALLELGSGFNPEFTGIENVRLNAAVLGLREKEIDAKLDAILAFADIGSFVEQPVKHYSSGMVVRLAFAVQAHIDPTILIVDEALAVGDELFQKKCFTRLESLKEEGTSILLVSHSCSQINQHCDEVLLLNKGKVQITGKPQRITVLYQKLIGANDEEWEKGIRMEKKQQELESNQNSKGRIGIEEQSEFEDITCGENKEARWDDSLKPQTTQKYPPNGLEITSIFALTVDGNKVNRLGHGQHFDIRIEMNAERDFDGVRISCFIANTNGTRVTGQTMPTKRGQTIDIKKGMCINKRFRFYGGLWPGYYFLGAGVTKVDSQGEFLHRVIDMAVIVIEERDGSEKIGDVDLSRR